MGKVKKDIIKAVKMAKSTITNETPLIGKSTGEINMKTTKSKTSSGTLALDKTQQKKVSKETKRIKKGLKDGTITLDHKERKQKLAENRGLIYIGHIPHGFYEVEMKNYFKQFGKVTNVKVCRSRISGKSKGFGYVEFQHPEVAQIAAETMDNYVMFKKRIVSEYIPYEKRPKGLFHGKSSNLNHTSVKTRQGKQKYSKNKIQDQNTIVKKAKKSLKKLNTKVEKLKSLGIQCNVTPVGMSDEVTKKIKVEPKSKISLRSSLSKNLEIQKSSKPKKSLKASPSSKSTTGVKSSNRLMLAKSLDSVKALLKNSNLTNAQDQETQTPKLKTSKRDKTVKRKVAKGGISKVKKEKNLLNLNKDVVKKIARELIRKRGNPNVNIKTSTTKISKIK